MGYRGHRTFLQRTSPFPIVDSTQTRAGRPSASAVVRHHSVSRPDGPSDATDRLRGPLGVQEAVCGCPMSRVEGLDEVPMDAWRLGRFVGSVAATIYSVAVGTSGQGVMYRLSMGYFLTC
jgi:hypothetical protein